MWYYIEEDTCNMSPHQEHISLQIYSIPVALFSEFIILHHVVIACGRLSAVSFRYTKSQLVRNSRCDDVKIKPTQKGLHQTVAR
jgi:hypothetical protein